MWDRTCILAHPMKFKQRLIVWILAIKALVSQFNSKQQNVFLSSEFKEYWKECRAMLCFQQWSLLTAVLMSCIDDGYVDLSLALLFKSPGGNRWMWGVDDELFLNADPYYGLRMGLQITIWNTGSLNKLLLLLHRAKPFVHLENPLSFLFVDKNKCAVWRWCEILIFVCKYTKTCQKQQAGFGVQFNLAGFDRGDSISNAGSSFEKAHFLFHALWKMEASLWKEQ